MKIRQALRIISTLNSQGNKPGSFRDANDFMTQITNVLRNVGNIEEKPNGNNRFPSFTLNNVDFQIKTAKGKSPMWNEVYIRPNSVLIMKLDWGITIVHGSLITDSTLEKKLIAAKEFAADNLKNTFPKSSLDNFYVTGGRVQFGDNIDWFNQRKSFLDDTILILLLCLIIF